MDKETAESEPINANHVGVRPAGMREFTFRSVIAAVFVAAVMGASYPYIVLKLGFGPNVSVVAAFLGYVALGLAFKNYNRWENNIVQTAGTSAAQTAFMCVLLAAFDLLAQSKLAGQIAPPTFIQSFAWLTAASALGLLLAVPMRQHFIVDEKLTFADGVAAAETLIVLDSRGKEARAATIALGTGALLSALVLFATTKWAPSWLHIEDTWFPAFFASFAWASMGTGVSVSLLSLGSGMLVGTRINVSMLIGTIISWYIAPKLLLANGIIHIPAGRDAPVRIDVLQWVMWPATALLVAGGLTALVLRWKLLIKTFKHFSGDAIKGDEFPLKWVAVGCGVATVALLIIQRAMFDIPVWMTALSVVLALPLMLVGLRVLGETNWGPISALSNMMQGIFAFVAPGHVGANMTASGTTGTIATQSEAIMQDYKTGHMIGSTPRYLTYAQLIAAPIGAAAVSFIYPKLRATYGIGGDTPGSLSSPISQKWARFAEFLSEGLKALPPGALYALIAAAVAGVILTVLEARWRRFTPSPTGIGIGMLVPGSAIAAMAVGGLLDLAWRRFDRKSAERLVTPLASGLIAGEAVLAVVIPLLIAMKILTP